MGIFRNKTNKHSFNNHDVIGQEFNCSDMDDLINTFSHFELHTLAAAIYFLAKKVNLLDPNHETFISEEMVLNIKEKNVINEAIYMVKTAADMYELEKGNIDNKYKRHLN